MVHISDAFEVEGFVEQRKELDRLLMSNPAMEKKVQGLIRKVLAAVKKSLGKAASEKMDSDPRHAYKAIRTAVYKRILGGNVNILNKRRASNAGGSYTPTHTLRSKQRGGNRRARNERTYKLESYEGSDRGFILRFINAGTVDRQTRYGNRGYLRAHDWFGRISAWHMNTAANDVVKMVEEMLNAEFKLQ
jgi:hypothetical protein